jgi:indole-3-glycerol phosphate synthase
MILDEIVAAKREELEEAKRLVPIEKISQMALRRPRPLDLAAALRGDRVRLIAEVKKASPSRGLICENFNPVNIAKVYSKNHAAAISVLTEIQYFQGNLDYLSYIYYSLGEVRPPLLRKDFIFDPYQVYESRAYGADAILLIVAILRHQELAELLALSHSLNMQCLVEVHNENETKLALESGARIIGINNRDLKTFKVDINTTTRLRPIVPASHVVVSESGIKNREDIARLQSCGVQAALVGETLMTAPDIALKMKELM